MKKFKRNCWVKPIREKFSTMRFRGMAMKNVIIFIGALLIVAFAFPAYCVKTVWLDELDVTRATSSYGEPHKNKSVEGRTLKIGEVTSERGLGTHAESVLRVSLQKGTTKFRALVGVDDEVDPKDGGSAHASVEFQVIGDKKLLWKSGI